MSGYKMKYKIGDQIKFLCKSGNDLHLKGVGAVVGFDVRDGLYVVSLEGGDLCECAKALSLSPLPKKSKKVKKGKEKMYKFSRVCKNCHFEPSVRLPISCKFCGC